MFYSNIREIRTAGKSVKRFTEICQENLGGQQQWQSGAVIWLSNFFKVWVHQLSTEWIISVKAGQYQTGLLTFCRQVVKKIHRCDNISSVSISQNANTRWGGEIEYLRLHKSWLHITCKQENDYNSNGLKDQRRRKNLFVQSAVNIHQTFQVAEENWNPAPICQLLANSPQLPSPLSVVGH